MPDLKWEYLYVIYRFDRYLLRSATADIDIDEYVVVKEVLPTEEDAQREVERLSALQPGSDIEYHYQKARFYRAGREVASGQERE